MFQKRPPVFSRGLNSENVYGVFPEEIGKYTTLKLNSA
jgi:hypothetical protein